MKDRAPRAVDAAFNTHCPLPPWGWARAKPADCAIHIRGEDSQLGEVIPRGFPRVLTTRAAPVNPAQSGRLELAEWIASRDHPLTARVMVNRIWQHLFGDGIVETPTTLERRAARAIPRCSITSRDDSSRTAGR